MNAGRFSSRRVDLRLVLLGLLLIVATNAVVLAGVAWNRSGPSDAIVELTERELELPWASAASRENSGLHLQLRWRVAERQPGAGVADEAVGDEALVDHDGAYYGSQIPWLDAERLRALGFDVDGAIDAEAHRRHRVARPAWLVLELGGQPQAQALARAERRHAAATERTAALPDDREARDRLAESVRQLAREREQSSRLFVIDVGTDADQLREAYADRSRYLILRGHVRLVGRGDVASPLRGSIAAVDIDRIHVPLQFHGVFASHFDDEGRGDARHAVTLASGARREPWIVAAASR
jgi:hypothetical protein